MILTFNKRAFAALLAVTALEALIATLGAPYPLLRGFVGDVVAVGWAYLVYRSFIRADVLPLALAALFTGYAVELGQYLARHFGWRLEQPVLRVILGSVPDWWDMLAYTLGFFLVLALAAWNRRRAWSRAAAASGRCETARRARPRTKEAAAWRGARHRGGRNASAVVDRSGRLPGDGGYSWYFRIALKVYSLYQRARIPANPRLRTASH